MLLGKIFLFIVAMFLVMFIFNRIMAKVLKVEKKRIFSNNYVNELHKKLDWILLIAFIIVFIVFNMGKIEYPQLANNPWYFLGVLSIIFVLGQLVRVFMEWKYATNRRDYLYTLSEMLFMVIIIFTFAQTNFLGLIN
ncbi:DUF4181 domain-containing protein [Psychrobacillus sp. NEAU-3TGS]|uniref:DUF4181 domain-containing protein n=1 Tax=Psychrobacillus sp. NEAU-3TGS TaxID=2995412 RepID=UPI002496A21A|nr:DUF4181 domain-containing protein [Psychrobacillus sp. NEAU-3TGS]MDI2588447.1 DUF4181 domain-containing protein [Psychrobacillus sp. NEAU-3TGS]